MQTCGTDWMCLWMFVVLMENPEYHYDIQEAYNNDGSLSWFLPGPASQTSSLLERNLVLATKHGG